jgi:hypothetical protein
MLECPLGYRTYLMSEEQTKKSGPEFVAILIDVN